MQYIAKRFRLATLFLLVAGCSTITTGTQQTITVDTPLAAGASCTLSDTKNRTWQVPKTPASLVVEKGDGPMTLICEKEGYHKTTAVIDEEFAGATLGNVILGGGVGILIDAASGAAQKYPEEMKVWMLPLEFASAEEEKKWQKAKADYEEAKRKEKEF